MNPNDVLRDVLERLDSDEPRADTLTGATLSGWPLATLNELLEVGLIEETTPEAIVECPECGDGHWEAVTQVGGRNVLVCPSVGLVEVQSAQMLRWRVSVPGLINALRIAASIEQSAAPREHLRGRWWKVGAGELLGVRRGVWLARGLHWADGGAQLQARMADARPGDIVLIPTPRACDRRADLWALTDILAWEGTGITLRFGKEEGPLGTSTSTGYRFRRNGDTWELAFAGSPIVAVRDLKGMADIARLLATPNVAIPAWDLMSIAVAPQGPTASHDDHLAVTYLDGVEQFDDQAHREVLAVSRELEEKIAAARENGDLDELAECIDQLDKIKSYLGQGTDRWGKRRTAGGAFGKSRTAVKNRITTAIAAIEEKSEAMASHLRLSIKTGHFVVYKAERSLPWEL